MSKSEHTLLREDKTLPILGEGGLVHRHLPSFEVRPQQQEMLRAILKSYNEETIALIEAGTGTGKSMAYLLPALLWSLHNKQITVVSTNTIALQEQLFNKDVPLLAKALNIEFKAVLVKGMHNYLCLRKLDDSKHELPLLPENEAYEMTRIEAWSSNTQDGTRSDLPFAPSYNSWDRVSADGDTCTREQCPYFKQCHFFNARKQAQEAQLLIVNHHLLFSDIARRMESQGGPPTQSAGILPNYTRTIVDEAHNLEDIATEFLATKTSLAETMRLFGLLATDKQLKSHGKLPLLKLKIEQLYKKTPPSDVVSLLQRLQIELIAQRKALMDQFFDTFQLFQSFAINNGLNKDGEDSYATPQGNLRILPHHYDHPFWKNEIIPKVTLLEENAKRYFQSIASLVQDLQSIDDVRIQDSTRGLRVEIHALRLRLERCLLVILQFTHKKPEHNKVRWIEVQQTKTLYNTTLVDASLDVSTTLAQQFFSRFQTTVLCSATLASNKEFRFLRSRLGLHEALLPKIPIHEHIFESPFDFEKQSLLVIPNDLPEPSQPDFLEKACEGILHAIRASKGNAFVLFTSYATLKQCYSKLHERLCQEKYHPCKQGDEPRIALIERFKKKDRSILFGTDSFWEGVDVAGEALRCVILFKLPFQVPSEPIVEARTQAITANGGNPFMQYSVPNATVKFKQGFGRLIRHKKDRGVIVCLDSRIINKKYGHFFLNSLPPCQLAKIPMADMSKVMEDFYRQTYRLTL